MLKPILAALALSTLAAVAVAHAEGKKHPCHPPPKEAVEACDGADAGDACSFQDPNGGTVSGTCFKPDDAPKDAPLACAPADAQGR